MHAKQYLSIYVNTPPLNLRHAHTTPLPLCQHNTPPIRSMPNNTPPHMWTHHPSTYTTPPPMPCPHNTQHNTHYPPTYVNTTPLHIYINAKHIYMHAKQYPSTYVNTPPSTTPCPRNTHPRNNVAHSWVSHVAHMRATKLHTHTQLMCKLCTQLMCKLCVSCATCAHVCTWATCIYLYITTNIYMHLCNLHTHTHPHTTNTHAHVHNYTQFSHVCTFPCANLRETCRVARKLHMLHMLCWHKWRGVLT